MSARLRRCLDAVDDRVLMPLRHARWTLEAPLHRECQEAKRLAFKVGRDCERDSLGLPAHNHSGYFAPEVLTTRD